MQSGVAAGSNLYVLIFLRRAEELGLECVEIQNLTDFYEDYRYLSLDY